MCFVVPKKRRIWKHSKDLHGHKTKAHTWCNGLQCSKSISFIWIINKMLIWAVCVCVCAGVVLYADIVGNPERYCQMLRKQGSSSEDGSAKAHKMLLFPEKEGYLCVCVCGLCKQSGTVNICDVHKNLYCVLSWGSTQLSNTKQSAPLSHKLICHGCEFRICRRWHWWWHIFCSTMA